ncbi:MAG TPA: Do family serine endopeptidase [Nannocystaceae bacterium]|nr:Do family serine endopeptidase [Nannocystaceae bacterium]
MTLALGCSGARGAESVEPMLGGMTASADETPAPPSAKVAAIDDLEVAFKHAIKDVGPSVVSIYTSKSVDLRGAMPMRDPFDRFGRGLPDRLDQQGLGSGVVIDRDGHVLTNNHVVAGAENVRVKLADGSERAGTIVGTDPATDLALLKIDGESLAPAELGSSDKLEVGDWVLAIGSPFGLSQTVSAGIVSAVGRASLGIVDYEDFIQTDAAVNPGNSGGPLVDLDGRVVGINTAIASRTGANNGVAFAVPIDLAKHIVDQLRTRGKVSRGQLGVVISELSDELAASFDYAGKGILVQDVKPGSAAAKAGITAGDIVVELAGKPVDDVARFRMEIARTTPGTDVALVLWRDGKRRALELQLDALETGGVEKRNVSAAMPTMLGLRLSDVTPQLRERLQLSADAAVVITDVAPGSIAARAGIAPGDTLERVGDEPVRSASAAVELLREHADEGVRVRVRHGESGRFVWLKTQNESP